MKKLLTLLLFLLPILTIAQTKQPKYYYDSSGGRHSWDSAKKVAIQRTIDSMKIKGYLKPKKK